MSSGPSFIEDEIEEKAEETRDSRPDLSDSPVTFDGERMDEFLAGLENVAVPTPNELAPDGIQNRQERRVGESSDLLQQLLEQTNLNLDEISENINNIDLDGMGQNGLLQVIAQMQINNFQLFQAMLNTQVSTLSSTIDIADAVEPPRAITVSGVNSISNAGQAEPLVPQSNNTEILTRQLFIRADENNSSEIYIGDDEVSPDEGFMLKPGESWELPIDLRDDAYWMAGDEAGDSVQLLGVV